MTITTIKGRVVGKFPASVTGEAPIIVTNTGGNYVISIDDTALEELASPNFLSLDDTPDSYSGQGNKAVVVNAGGTALEFLATTSTNFLALTDTPDSFSGQAGKVVAVNPGATALQFSTPAAGTGGMGLNVMDFGAVGDGVADDAPAIQATIDAAFDEPNAGVYVPSGQYKCYSRPIFVDPPGNLRGADGTNGVTWNSGTSYVVNNTVNRLGVAYISIQNGSNKPPESEPTFWRVFAWASGTTYALDDVVSFGGVPWKSLTNGNIGNTPTDFGSELWRPWYIQPTNFAFSMHFFGLHGGNHEGSYSSRLLCNDSDNWNGGVFVGPGQGMRIANLTIYKANPGVPKIAKRGWGIAVAGGPAGATRTTLENCLIEQFEIGIFIGFNSDALCDSNLIYRCNVWGNYIGCFIAQTQNFINQFIECSFSNLIQIWSQNGCTYNVYGGNYSVDCDRAVFTLTGVSAVTTSGTNPTENTFTATVTNGDANLDAGVYERFAIKTARWGIVPLVLVDWNTSTNVITLMLDQNWQTNTYGLNYDPIASFETDIAAVTKLYANEWARTFIGPAHVRGIHIENANACQTFLWVKSGFAADNSSLLEDIYVNNSFHGGDANDSEPSIAAFFTQIVTPHILIDNDGCVCKIRNLKPPSGAGRVNFNIWEGSQKGINNIILEQCDDLIPFILVGSTCRVLSDTNLYESGQVSGSTYEYQWVRYGDGHSHFLKYWPHPASVPLIEEATLAAWLAGTDLAAGAFVPMMGEGQTYKLRNTTTLADIVNIKSTHRYYTLSADITRNWAYKGGSLFFYTTSAANLRPGQAIVLDNGVSGDVIYLIMNVWIVETSGNTILCLLSRIGGGVGAGVAGTEYTGATIKQQDPVVTYQVTGDTNFQSPSTGFSITLGNRDAKLVLAPAGTLATGTITMCATPRDRQTVEIRSKEVVTTLTISPGGGQSVANPPTTIAAGGFISAYYRAANTTWYF